MLEARHLSHAPLVEASINFQVDASQHWDALSLSTTLQALWKDYPEMQAIQPVEFQIAFDLGAISQPVVKSPHIQGLVFRSKAAMLQARRDGFSYSKLPPYADWESLKIDAFSKWEDFQSVLMPKELHGVGIRFSNRLEFERDGFRLGRFFAAPPTVPGGLNWLFHSFQQTAVYAPPNSPCAVRVTSAPAFIADPMKTVAFMMDIEVITPEGLAASNRDASSILEEMRTLKNQAFFNLLTEEAIERYM